MKPLLVLLAATALLQFPAYAQTPPTPPATYDAEMAKNLGGDENGLRPYVMVFLKTGPKRMPDGPERKAMFAGHFANMERLGKEKKLVMAGPLDGVDGMRGIFVFATKDIEEARALVATDPVIVNGEMVAEYHKFFASAGLMAVNGIHAKLQKQ